MYTENIFLAVKEKLSMEDAAKFYGLQISRSGMACCPFHEDNTPSLKIYDDHFYCFGCGATGDCTGFTARLFNITQLEAAKKLSYDFGLNLFNGEIAVPVKTVPNTNAEYLLWLRKAKTDVSEYLNKLYEWRKKYAPRNIGEQLNPLFIESMQKTSYIEYLSELLDYGSSDEKRELFKNSKKEIDKINQRLKEVDKRKMKKVI